MRGIIFSMQFRNDSAYTSGLNSFYAELLVFSPCFIVNKINN